VIRLHRCLCSYTLSSGQSNPSGFNITSVTNLLCEYWTPECFLKIYSIDQYINSHVILNFYLINSWFGCIQLQILQQSYSYSKEHCVVTIKLTYHLVRTHVILRQYYALFSEYQFGQSKSYQVLFCNERKSTPANNIILL